MSVRPDLQPDRRAAAASSARQATCQGKVYQCGDCVDNDGDCRIDSADDQCLGPCDNNENSFYGGIPGQNNSPCKMDCYFDQDTGSGNDDCYWSHEVRPARGRAELSARGRRSARTTRTPTSRAPATSCAQAFSQRSRRSACDYCGPLDAQRLRLLRLLRDPGRADHGLARLGGRQRRRHARLDNVDDPTLCKPCTQVPACLNTCDTLRDLRRQADPPPDVTSGNNARRAIRPAACRGKPPARSAISCVTGCCQPVPGR